MSKHSPKRSSFLNTLVQRLKRNHLFLGLAAVLVIAIIQSTITASNSTNTSAVNLVQPVTLSYAFPGEISGQVVDLRSKGEQGFAAGASTYEMTPEEFYNLGYRLADENFLYVQSLGKGWSYWKDRYQGRLNSQNDAENALTEMVSYLSDTYSHFYNKLMTDMLTKDLNDKDVVSYHLGQDGNFRIALIKIKSFISSNTAKEVEEAVKAAVYRDGANGIILDLQDNHGGQTIQAMQTYSLFADKSVICLEMGRRNGYTYNYTSSLTADYILENTNFSDGKALKVVSASSETKPRLTNIAGSIPVVVLVDGTTASAAEMISGAFQDNKRASIIGSITYGKGILQRGWLFNNGTSLFVTVGNWYTPKGDSVSQRGIIPDYRVSKDQLYATAIRVLKQGK